MPDSQLMNHKEGSLTEDVQTSPNKIGGPIVSQVDDDQPARYASEEMDVENKYVCEDMHIELSRHVDTTAEAIGADSLLHLQQWYMEDEE
ncbi:hypothetical protein R1flu_015400 [Riccia fluitans]|uniref:Uncharacterized protein n=1 Tax=Riccia fluitans TaxID=41844 RepID=A0ABD1YM04_9MARC